MTFRVLVAFFSGTTAVITTVMIPFAHFGDKNETWNEAIDRNSVYLINGLSHRAVVLADVPQLA